jgi:hypothetical protein
MNILMHFLVVKMPLRQFLLLLNLVVKFQQQEGKKLHKNNLKIVILFTSLITYTKLTYCAHPSEDYIFKLYFKIMSYSQ